ncbi:glycosyltransferase family 92 protein At1g27200 [Benincasa hispida]|uniref:glycosyltransferase family 92 protein At1g27200 n=1 Tax=Benincasa hispida TaxID=102211 RepID=UPI001900320F|nr:glycosyltransferase family 92 protein At1g27200 [Benincasa hispida]
MRRKPRSTGLLFSVAVFLLFAFQFSRKAFFNGADLPFPSSYNLLPSRSANSEAHYALHETNIDFPHQLTHRTRHVSSILDPVPTVSLLLPDWEVLLISSIDTPLASPDSLRDFLCLFQNNATSSANFSGVLDFTGRLTFRCFMPESVRRLRPFFQPLLIKSPDKEFSSYSSSSLAPELMRWTFFAYEAFETEDDVVLFVKGVNHRQGNNRPPTDLNCVFGDGDNAVRTAVTSSVQEVFRCRHPNLTTREDHDKFKITLEILDKGKSVIVPSVAYYSPRRSDGGGGSLAAQSMICACTMVYNVGKFLKEWVMYYSRIGVDKFILYDNGSDDEISAVVKELKQEGYNIEIVFWIWPKTQEAGFSHSVEYSKKSCKWMMFVDIDEFVFSPSWLNSLKPSKNMVKSLLPAENNGIGMITVMCNDYGPSDRISHPTEGVTQGYNCRRKLEERHKSIVLLEAVDRSLLNVIHHFKLKTEFRSRQMRPEEAVVNHYKYQAWPEFRMKFRRRVSAYVVDWKDSANPTSKDRAPGLGNTAVEPPDWPRKFCEVRDDRLRLLTQRWFGSQTADGYRMAWQ